MHGLAPLPAIPPLTVRIVLRRQGLTPGVQIVFVLYSHHPVVILEMQKLVPGVLDNTVAETADDGPQTEVELGADIPAVFRQRALNALFIFLRHFLFRSIGALIR